MMKKIIALFIFTLLLNITHASTNDGVMLSTLRVGVVLSQPPFSYENLDGKPDGLSIKLWETVAEKLHLKYDYVILDGSKDIATLKLKDNMVDVVVSPLSVKYKSASLVDYSRPYFLNKTGLAVSAFRSSKTQLFIQEISNIILLVVVSFVAVFMVGGLLLWFSERKLNKLFPDSFLKGTSYSIKSVITMFFKFNFIEVITVKGRAILLGVILTATALVLATLVALSLSFSLALKEDNNSIVRNIDDINNKRVSVLERDATSSYIRSLGAKLIKVESSLEGLKQIRRKDVVGFIGDYYLTNYLINKSDFSDVVMSPLTIINDEYAFGFQKGSPLVEKVDSMLVKLQDNKTSSFLCAKYIGKEYAAKCIF